MSRCLHPFHPAVAADGVNQRCLVAVRRLQNCLLHPHHCLREVRHVKFTEACVPDLREAVRLERNVEPVLAPNECPVVIADITSGYDVRYRQRPTRTQPAMDLFQQRASILGHSEHVTEVHHVVTFRWLPLQHVSLDEIEAARKTVRMTLARARDLLRAHLHTSHATS